MDICLLVEELWCDERRTVSEGQDCSRLLNKVNLTASISTTDNNVLFHGPCLANDKDNGPFK